jgi:hypothetical protein
VFIIRASPRYKYGLSRIPSPSAVIGIESAARLILNVRSPAQFLDRLQHLPACSDDCTRCASELCNYEIDAGQSACVFEHDLFSTAINSFEERCLHMPRMRQLCVSTNWENYRGFVSGLRFYYIITFNFKLNLLFCDEYYSADRENETQQTK